MGKLTIFALLALFALAHVATAFRTTVTVVEEEDFNPARPQQRCQEQIQRQQQLRHCQMYLKEKTRRQTSVLEMSTDDNNEDIEEQYLDQCCQQLRNLNEQCRCKGLQEAVRQQQRRQETRGGERGQTEQRQKQRIVDEAERLPSRCEVSPRSCTFERSPRWF